MRRSVLTLTACLAAAFAAPAHADPQPDPSQIVQIVVRVGPTDLQSEPAVAALYQRVSEAASSVCAEVMAGTSPGAVSHYRSRPACQREVLEEAVSSADLAPLLAFHERTLGRQARYDEIASR